MSIEEKGQYMLDINDYEIVKLISKGGFGIIYLVRNKNKNTDNDEDTDNELAAKVNLIDITPNESIMNQQMVYRELTILMRAHHPTIIQFRGFSPIDFNKDENMVIFMDYMTNGSLDSLLDKSRNSLCTSNYNNTTRQIILAGIARGMMYLHSHNIIHRDLKPGNILLDKDFHPHITDFGLSKYLDPMNTRSQSKLDCGTTVYMAPEVIQDDSYNNKADVYAFGIIMYEVLTELQPYPKYIQGLATDYQIKSDVINGKRPSFDQTSIRSSFRSLIEQCWSQNPSERPSFADLFDKLSNYKEGQNKGEKIDENDESNNYCLEDVDPDTFREYIEVITKDYEKSDTTVNRSDSSDMAEILNQLKKQQAAIDSLQKEVVSLREKNHEFETVLSNNRLKIDASYSRCFGHSYEAKLNLKENNGIFSYLKTQETDKFDRLFIPSQSSNDIYNIIDPNTKDVYCSGSEGNFFVEFQLKEEVTIVSIKIKSSIFCFPKSFDILINNEVCASTKHAEELNGIEKELTFKIPSKRGKFIKIKQTGPNWDKSEPSEKNFFSLKNVELYSTDSKFNGKGVFETFINESESHDAHDCGVFIDAERLAFDSFFDVNSKERSINTHNQKNSFFQIHLKKGAVIINGFRLRKTSTRSVKTFMVVASDDVNKPLDEWNVLYDVNESSLSQNIILNIHETKMSPPVRFVRFVQTGLNWSGDRFLQFFHFDLFGYYIDNINF